MQRTAPAPEAVTDQLHAFLRHLMATTQGDVLRLAVEMDLTLTQLRVLHLLRTEESEPALGDLASRVGLSVAATGRAVDALVKAGHVSRKEDPVDRRVKRHALTAKGNRTMERLAAARRAGVETFVGGLSEEDRERLSAALEPLLERLA
jgi:DNA-binding MarR family transcriptional regulator